MTAGALTTRSRVAVHCLLGLVVAFALLVVIPTIGGGVNLREALAAGPSNMNSSAGALIFWGTRVPRVLLGFAAGGALALAGLVFQAVLRNPLAEPYILGISGGAALGKMLAVLLALRGFVVFFLLIPVFCFAGALAPILLLFSFSTRSRRFSPVTILLGGVVMNVFFTAVIMLLQYFADFTQVRQMFLWMMGGLDIVGYRSLAVALPLMAAACGVILTQTRAMNLLSLDHVTAAHLGLNVRGRVQILLWSSSILTSAVVALSGPIGFVGLLVPHTLRMIFGADNRMLAPLSLIYGGVFLVLCDFIGWRGMELLQFAGVPLTETTEIPVGIITAILGGPFFLTLLLKRARAVGVE